MIDEVASNGTKIIETIISLGTYRSITGATMQIDRYGDSEGNFTVLALAKSKDEIVSGNFTCPYQMRPVGQFHQGEYLEYKIFSNVTIEWPKGSIPIDEPSCGFMDELCKSNDTHLHSIIVAGSLAILLFCVGVVTISIYRKWKIEQEIEGLLWKIDKHDIKEYHEKGGNIVTSPSRVRFYAFISMGFPNKIKSGFFLATCVYLH